MPLEQSPTHPALHHRAAKSSPLGAPCKGQRHQIFPAIPAAGRAGSTMQFVSVAHSIGCCQQEREELGDNRGITAEGQLIRKAAQFVDLPHKLWDIPSHLISANEAGGPREISEAPHWICPQMSR